MGNSGLGLSEEAELLIVAMNAMGIPYIMPGPSADAYDANKSLL
jgi:hypothetical protein